MPTPASAMVLLGVALLFVTGRGQTAAGAAGGAIAPRPPRACAAARRPPHDEDASLLQAHVRVADPPAGAEGPAAGEAARQTSAVSVAGGGRHAMEARVVRRAGAQPHERVRQARQAAHDHEQIRTALSQERPQQRGGSSKAEGRAAAKGEVVAAARRADPAAVGEGGQTSADGGEASPAKAGAQGEKEKGDIPEQERGAKTGEKIDPAEEWKQLATLQIALPFLLAFVVVFECCHFKFSDVDWSMTVEYPQELRRMRFTSLLGGATGWLHEFIVSKEKPGTRTGLLLMLIGFYALHAYIKYSWTLWVGRWYNLLQYPNGNFPAFWPLLGNFAVLVMVDTFVSVYHSYTEAWLILDWKTFMTKRFRNLWLSHRAFYLMELHQKEDDHMDNPDQRISEDTASFVDTSYTLAAGLIRISMDLCVYVPMLWRLSPTSVFGWFDCKGWLLYVAIIWAMGGSMLTHLVGRVLIALKYAVQRYDADYRFGLVQVRTKSESIAMLGGEAAEERSLGEQWEHIRRVTWEFMVFNKRYWFIMAVYNHTEWLISLVVLVPSYVQGHLTLGTMRMAQSALGNVKNDLEFIISSWDTLTSWRAAVARLQTFEERHTVACGMMKQGGPLMLGGATDPDKPGFEQSTPPAEREVPGLRRLEAGEEPSIQVRGLRICLPTGQTMVTIDRLAVRPGDRVLVSGPVGIGKSSLMRTLSNIWPHSELAPDGEMIMPSVEDCLFVPRVPALPHVSLRDMINYPDVPGTYSDKQVLDVLELVGLSHLVARGAGLVDAVSGEENESPDEVVLEKSKGAVEQGDDQLNTDASEVGLGASQDWSKVLSGGEQQRAVIAHVVLRSPKFLFLDEATSSMSQEASLRLYGLMLDALGPQSAVVTISHDVPGMRPLHTAHYAIDPQSRRLEEKTGLLGGSA